MAQVIKGTVAVIAAVAIFVALCVGGWFLYWKLAASSTSRSAQINQQSYGAQSADIAQARALIAEIGGIEVQEQSNIPNSELAVLRAQGAAETTQACGVAYNIANPPADVAEFITNYCNTNG
jgi:hypothetical protein